MHDTASNVFGALFAIISVGSTIAALSYFNNERVWLRKHPECKLIDSRAANEKQMCGKLYVYPHVRTYQCVNERFTFTSCF